MRNRPPAKHSQENNSYPGETVRHPPRLAVTNLADRSNSCVERGHFWKRYLDFRTSTARVISSSLTNVGGRSTSSARQGNSCELSPGFAPSGVLCFFRMGRGGKRSLCGAQGDDPSPGTIHQWSSNLWGGPPLVSGVEGGYVRGGGGGRVLQFPTWSSSVAGK